MCSWNSPESDLFVTGSRRNDDVELKAVWTVRLHVQLQRIIERDIESLPWLRHCGKHVWSIHQLRSYSSHVH